MSQIRVRYKIVFPSKTSLTDTFTLDQLFKLKRFSGQRNVTDTGFPLDNTYTKYTIESTKYPGHVLYKWEDDASKIGICELHDSPDSSVWNIQPLYQDPCKYINF